MEPTARLAGWSYGGPKRRWSAEFEDAKPWDPEQNPA